MWWPILLHSGCLQWHTFQPGNFFWRPLAWGCILSMHLRKPDSSRVNEKVVAGAISCFSRTAHTEKPHILTAVPRHKAWIRKKYQNSSTLKGRWLIEKFLIRLWEFTTRNCGPATQRQLTGHYMKATSSVRGTLNLNSNRWHLKKQQTVRSWRQLYRRPSLAKDAVPTIFFLIQGETCQSECKDQHASSRFFQQKWKEIWMLRKWKPPEICDR